MTKNDDNDNDKLRETRKVKIEFYRPDDFKQVYSIGAIGGHSPYDFRIGFYNDSPRAFGDLSDSHVIERRVETEVILTPLAALELSRWLNQHIQDYENMFGPISKMQPVTEKPKDKPSKDSSEIQGYI
ncbi:MAG: DUF3467 domain-containing protein [Methanosarcinaceae archaeon]|nr:DUF3467 domain-containing protein [Methanosarcinaceae archaeon]MDF1533835.1 DUF3467 domain-containing protein [Methanosarcinaceae archaeon]